MAIVAFWSDEKRETGQTLSMVALSTYMAIEHNYKIINISTNFRDQTIEDCYWNLEKRENLVKNISDANVVGLESGIEGLIKIINSNKTSTNIVSNYTKIVFKDRLDVLCSPVTDNYEEYRKITEIYPQILQVARKSYDFVFIDVSKKMNSEQANKILEIADVIIVNLPQKLKSVDNYMKLKEENKFFKKNNIMVNIGRCDKFSKYNVKNVTRYLREKKNVNSIPYNTLFFESCSEGKVAEFFLRLRKVEPDDRNATFIEEISRLSKDLVYKIQELQIKAK